MSKEIIKILDNEVRIIEWQDQRVVMTKDIAKLHGIEVKHINEKYRRNKKYFKEGYDYFEIKQDDKRLVENCDQSIKELLFRNPADYVLLITEAGYLNFIKTINDDRAWAIFLELKKIYFHAKQSKELRDKTKEVRKSFTDILKDYGYDKKHHFIQTSMQMKKQLNITHKKDEMTNDELELILASEILAKHNIKNTNKNGYYEVNPVCVNSSKAVNELITNKTECIR
jgi:murein L,D-transpeptidase YafK